MKAQELEKSSRRTDRDCLQESHAAETLQDSADSWQAACTTSRGSVIKHKRIADTTQVQRVTRPSYDEGGEVQTALLQLDKAKGLTGTFAITGAILEEVTIYSSNPGATKWDLPDPNNISGG